MTKDNERERLYVQELAHSRLRQLQRKQNQTFSYCNFGIRDEIDHAVKYSNWGLAR